MIRLTPFAETISGRELIRNERLSILMQQIRHKFKPSHELVENISDEVKRLDAADLKELILQMFDINTIEELKTLIATHTPAAETICQDENGWLDDDLPKNET